jgi:hypothetical protein
MFPWNSATPFLSPFFHQELMQKFSFFAFFAVLRTEGRAIRQDTGVRKKRLNERRVLRIHCALAANRRQICRRDSRVDPD